MKRNITLALLLTLVVGAFLFIPCYLGDGVSATEQKAEKPPKRTRIDEAVKYRKEITKDPATGEVPTERMLAVYKQIEQLKASTFAKNGDLAQVKWRERGPYNVAGRTRAILIDQNDPTGNTIFTAGVTGGLWKTTKINSNFPEWEVVNDNFENLNISAIGQNPANPQEIYFGTGEPHGSAGRGLGIWKSSDGGQTWTHLPSTINSNFYYVVRLVGYPNGDMYAGTEAGLFRSQDGGQTWIKVLGFGVSFGKNDITDIELASDGTLYVSTGHNTGSCQIYKSLPGANVGDIDNWQNITTVGFPNGQTRAEIAVAHSDPNILYALTAQGGDATGIYRTTNGGQSWGKTSNAPSALGMGIFTRGQAWYDLTIAVAPDNPSLVIIGGIDNHRSFDGGSTWTQIGQWFGGGGYQYVHADQHEIVFDKNFPNRVYLGNDGGIWRSLDYGTTIRDRNNGYNVTQFYAAAIHPGLFSNYFLAGAQDNGSHQFDDFDIATTREVRGGDGFLCHIDQNEPQYQMVSLYYGDYVLSNNGGQSFDAGGISIGGSSGFLNPSDYDDEANILYARANVTGAYYRWDINTFTEQEVNITNTNSLVRVVQVSPNIDNRIYIGMSNGRIMRIDNAHTGNSKTATVFNTPSGGSISSIAIEKGNEDHIIVTKSNFGVTSVYESTNGGTTLNSIEGNLPDMPVNWAVFHPTNNDKVFLATDAGVWTTENIDGSSTQWLPCLNGMPTVRTDMLQFRESDGVILACTYGRGLFTTDFLSPSTANFNINQAGYLDKDVKAKDISINSQKWDWNFDDGTTSSEPSPTKMYDAVGTYDVSLTVNDTLTTTKTVQILPDRDLPYVKGASVFGGDFESLDEDFAPYTISGTPFEKGESTITGKNGTKSGANAWVLGLNEDWYEHNSESMLYTPNFDLSEPGIYELSFWTKYSTQYGWDGFRVEYSTDKGDTWLVLGEERDGWYNYNNDDINTAFPRGSSYFTGTITEFTKFRTGLAEVEGQPNVAFRFVFKSNESGRQQGIAIDDFQIRKYTDILETRVIEFVGEFEDEDEVRLDWTTLPEYRCKGFYVQYSTNGRDYTEFPTIIDGQGSSIDPIAYAFNPANLRQDLYFFRLRVVDFEDNFFYTDVITLRRGAFSTEDLDLALVFPNPFRDYVEMTFNNTVAQELTINLYDMAGRLVFSEIKGTGGVFYRIEVPKLQSGAYVLQVIAGETVITRKLVKH